MRKFFIIILAFAAVLFLCCAEFPDIEFPSWEGEEISSSSESSSSSEPGSSSSAESSSSAVSSSSEPGSSSSAESSSSASSSSSEPGSSSSSSVLASSSSLATSSSSSLKGCEGTFNPANKFCYDGGIYDKCDGMEYIPVSQICENGVAVPARCNGAGYNPLMQGCCGNTLFSKATQRCGAGSIVETSCGSSWYNAATQFCQAGTNEVKSLCGGATFTAAEFCSGGEVLGKCGGTEEYNPSTENCCGSNKYTLATQFCQAGTNEVKSLCGDVTFTAAEFCSGTSIVDKCGGTSSGAEYNPSTEGCCGTATFTQATQFCYASSSKVGSFCGNRKAELDKYDPDKYECRSSTNANGIYLKADISYEGKSYKAVLIGSQTWMAENLNYNASGSKCYAEGVSGVSADSSNKNCATYGKLYNWATAMANSASSTATPSGVKGVCPTGWHLPSDAEWDALMTAVGGSSTAGTKLKAVSGWNTGSGYIAGKDDYGFSALPGGLGHFDGSFDTAGSGGRWWSATENSVSNAYFWRMDYSLANVDKGNYGKTDLRSVRCVQD